MAIQSRLLATAVSCPTEGNRALLLLKGPIISIYEHVFDVKSVTTATKNAWSTAPLNTDKCTVHFGQ